MLILKDEEVREEISSALANIQQPVQGRILRVGSVELGFGTVNRVGKNPGFFKKTQPSGFFGFFWFFLGFLGFLGFFEFFGVFLPKREGF
jgi:hypothetical protein